MNTVYQMVDAKMESHWEQEALPHLTILKLYNLVVKYPEAKRLEVVVTDQHSNIIDSAKYERK